MLTLGGSRRQGCWGAPGSLGPPWLPELSSQGPLQRWAHLSRVYSLGGLELWYVPMYLAWSRVRELPGAGGAGNLSGARAPAGHSGWTRVTGVPGDLRGRPRAPPHHVAAPAPPLPQFLFRPLLSRFGPWGSRQTPTPSAQSRLPLPGHLPPTSRLAPQGDGVSSRPGPTLLDAPRLLDPALTAQAPWCCGPPG